MTNDMHALTSLDEGARAFRRNLEHAQQRQAEVDANPAPQRWEIEQARDAVTRASVALAVLGAVTAMQAAAP